jgi:hypothetical protein
VSRVAARHLTDDELEAFAEQSLIQLIREREAAVLAEAVAILAESEWLRQRVPDFPYPRLDPHVVRRARRVLIETGDLVELTSRPSGREVKALVHGPLLRSRGKKTAIERAAATKRAVYRSYLTWTTDNSLCGGVAERVVVASMEKSRGLLYPTTTPGNVREIDGQQIAGGRTVDAKAHVVVDPDAPGRPARPLIPIGVEVKNIRQEVYPDSVEVWELLTKLAPLSGVVPVLICRRSHPTLAKMFGDLGAIVRWTNTQWFSDRIPDADFARITRQLSFSDARRVAKPEPSSPALVGFFEKTLRAGSYDGTDPRPLIERSLERWEQTREIVGGYSDLAESLQPDDQDRFALLADFRKDGDAAGLRTYGW